VVLRQRRIGMGGRPFTVYKFRTMHADRRRDDDGYAGPDRRRTHKSADDPRLTATGRLLRRLSLDELPQLVNVLRGEMSLVGPRPELPVVVERHYADWQHRRHAVKPGLTGLWQVSERGNGMMHEHVDVDLDYVDQVSLGTDLRILLRTLPAALTTHQGF
jgi:lipopolysaccharide/colanic/teichoic acid biosynthesis glycosyltransferase